MWQSFEGKGAESEDEEMEEDEAERKIREKGERDKKPMLVKAWKKMLRCEDDSEIYETETLEVAGISTYSQVGKKMRDWLDEVIATQLEEPGIVVQTEQTKEDDQVNIIMEVIWQNWHGQRKKLMEKELKQLGEELHGL